MNDSPKEPTPDRDLLALGWVRRFMADPQRATEAKELYEGMGLQVKLVPLAPLEFSTACGDCAEVASRDQVVVYTLDSNATGPGYAV